MEQNKIAGVYSITNNVTGDLYVGSSKNIKKRWVDHKCPSVHKQHPNSKLYKDMAEFGLDNFKFEVLEKTADLKKREQYWIEKLSPTYNDRYADGYNIKRCKETNRRHSKEWYKIHRDEKLAHGKAYYQTHRDEKLAHDKAYHQAHRDKDLTKMKAYCNRLCFYKGETLTLGTLSARFRRQGILHPTLEAKKYLIVK